MDITQKRVHSIYIRPKVPPERPQFPTANGLWHLHSGVSLVAAWRHAATGHHQAHSLSSDLSFLVRLITKNTYWILRHCSCHTPENGQLYWKPLRARVISSLQKHKLTYTTHMDWAGPHTYEEVQLAHFGLVHTKRLSEGQKYMCQKPLYNIEPTCPDH